MRVPRVRRGQLSTDVQQWLSSGVPDALRRSRTNIVSEALCEDSLKLLEKQLPDPKSCDIIDINPGACVWSKAIHKIVQPHRHILIERDRELYAPFLDPLLRQKQSPYRYASDLNVVLDPKQGILSNHVTQSADNKQETSKAELSKTLLVIANLTGPATKVIGFSGSQGSQFLNNYYHAMFIQGPFMHRYGLVRMIAWVDDVTRRKILTSSACALKKQHVQLDAAFKIHEIAGPSPYVPAKGFSWTRRWYELDNENYKALAKIKRKDRVEVPSHRQPAPGPPPLSYWEPTSTNLEQHQHLYPDHEKFIDRYLALDELAAKIDPKWYKLYTKVRQGVKGSAAKQPKWVRDTSGSPEILRFRLSTNRLRTHYNNHKMIRKNIRQHRRMWLLLKKLFQQADVDSPEHSARLTKLMADWDIVQEQTNKMKQDNRILIEKAVDDYRAYDSEPRALAWNRRRHEPLVIQPSEFDPERSLALIDFQPRPEFIEQLHKTDQQICFDFIVQKFFVHPNDTIVQAIQRIMPAGWEEFLETMPNLKNPAKGGFPALEHLRIRSLHYQFFIDLAVSLEKWPFRPSIESMMAFQRTVFDAKL